MFLNPLNLYIACINIKCVELLYHSIAWELDSWKQLSCKARWSGSILFYLFFYCVILIEVESEINGKANFKYSKKMACDKIKTNTLPWALIKTSLAVFKWLFSYLFTLWNLFRLKEISIWEPAGMLIARFVTFIYWKLYLNTYMSTWTLVTQVTTFTVVSN